MPSGLVTFVVTDIEGSTRMLREHHEEYPEVLEQHHEVLERAWSAWGGCRVDRQGDGSLVAFADPEAAIHACLRAQADLREHPWPGGVHPKVRMGVHTGLATPSGPDGDRYVSLAVHQASRIGAAAHGGQVLVSGATATTVREPPLHPIGRFRVRDFDHPIDLYQGEPGFPPPRCRPAEKHNLRPPAARLIGRGEDLAALDTLVGAGHRLITVVGAGGTGKTRLVTEWAVAEADRWPDGIWLVDCSPVDDAALLPATIADALGLHHDHGSNAVRGLGDQLGERRTTVILDGCEHLSGDIAALTTELLATCPGVVVVVTSTEPLHLPDERLCRLEPLASTGPDSHAVRLFWDRARAVNPALTDDASARRAAEAICRRLDGLPLAVEIAAARANVLHPAQILAGLDDGLRLMRVTDPTRPERHRGLDALLTWNFSLLTPAEDRAAQRLSLLAASFDVDTATAVIAEDDVDGAAVPDLVWSLVDKSLLVADPSAGGTAYRSLEIVRTFARARLIAHGDADRCAARLARHYVHTLGPAQGTNRFWLDAIATELDNVRAVLAFLGPEHAAVAQELACAIARYHTAVQSLRVGIAEVGGLVHRWPQATASRVGLLTALGDLHTRAGDFGPADDLVHQAHELREEVGPPPWDECGVDKVRGEVALARDRADEAADIARQALQSGAPSPRGRARMWNLLGIAEATAGRIDRAREAFEGELAAAIETGDDVLLAHAYSNAAEIAARQGLWVRAARHQRTCLEIAVSLGQLGTIAYSLQTAARIAVAAQIDDENWPVAVRLVAKAESLLIDTGLAQYGTDSKVIEEFVLQARRVLGSDRYHREVVAGRELDANDACTAALQYLDVVGGVHRSSGNPVDQEV